MQKQIRINVTPSIKLALTTLKKKKYFTLNDSEIIKYLIAKDLEELNNKHDFPIELWQNMAEKAFELNDETQDIYTENDIKN